MSAKKKIAIGKEEYGRVTQFVDISLAVTWESAIVLFRSMQYVLCVPLLSTDVCR